MCGPLHRRHSTKPSGIVTKSGSASLRAARVVALLSCVQGVLFGAFGVFEQLALPAAEGEGEKGQ